MCVEFFCWLGAFISQEKNPPLFHPLLGPDLITAFGFYLGLAFAWTIIERRWGLRYKDIFIIGLIFSVCIEQLGAILIAFNPILYVYVFVVYISMVLPGFIIVPPVNKGVPIWKRYVLGLLLLAFCVFAGSFLSTFPFTHVIPEKPMTAGF